MIAANGAKTAARRVRTVGTIVAKIVRIVGNGPAPAVLLLHGGGITDHGGRWQMAGIAGRLAERAMRQ